VGKPPFRLFLYFFLTLIKYSQIKLVKFIYSLLFYKKWTVRKLLWRRGQLFRPAVHLGVAALALLAIVGGTIFGPLPSLASQAASNSSDVLAPQTTTETVIPEDRPRAEIIEHEVVAGETLSTLATQYNISVETIKWANNLSSDNVTPGQKLQILPVTGVTHKVVTGETLESVAKRHQASAQAMLDFPFNDVPDDLSLKPGQNLIVPDGRPYVPPQPKAPPIPARSFASVPTRPASTGWVWPVSGVISQYFSWYHSGIDIAGPIGTPVVAVKAGRVTRAQILYTWGGRNVAIDHGGGLATTYNHLSYFIVSAGQYVAQGQVIGYRGMTGRATGPHLHFEVMVNGRFVNPMLYLR
jgi:murein DD-endopeptidase MepM/ murein hydrolase activator NlpD